MRDIFLKLFGDRIPLCQFKSEYMAEYSDKGPYKHHSQPSWNHRYCTTSIENVLAGTSSSQIIRTPLMEKGVGGSQAKLVDEGVGDDVVSETAVYKEEAVGDDVVCEDTTTAQIVKDNNWNWEQQESSMDTDQVDHDQPHSCKEEWMEKVYADHIPETILDGYPPPEQNLVHHAEDDYPWAKEAFKSHISIGTDFTSIPDFQKKRAANSSSNTYTNNNPS